MDRNEYDRNVLLLCEDITQLLKKSSILEESVNPLLPSNKRIKSILSRVETERRLIEEVSLPCRFMIEHLTMMLNNKDYAIGFKYDNAVSGKGLLNHIVIDDWGNVTLTIGNVDITWRDQEMLYLFYLDKIVLRQKDSGEDIVFFFNYNMKMSHDILSAYQDVKDDENTLYWHEDLNINKN